MSDPAEPTRSENTETQAPTASPENETPAKESSFPIVGIGASAGGLEAYKQLLAALPADTGMAFVFIQHLAPLHESMLPEILSRSTSMPVVQVQDEPKVEPNHIYVIPPNQTMVMVDGALSLQPRPATRGLHRPIDAFLRSLAEDRTHQAVGVVLSGTGTDGTLGLEAIKAEGGITFAQDASAGQDGMPQSAISADCVDFVLSPAEIAAELARIGRQAYVFPDKAGPPQAPGDEPVPDDAIGQILRLLNTATGVDFRNYKSTTLYRRIMRRMLLLKLDGVQKYLDYLQKHADEVQDLYRDILISVTAFFRDPEALEALKEKVIPQLLKNCSSNNPVRIWVLGCSTGEEAYSIAITFAETAKALDTPLHVQIFATDLNEHGIEKARLGLYSKNIVQDVSPERLRLFFDETEGGYQICRPIREMCVFARQNVLSDPPFSRMDMITCRNLLIYMEPILQRKILPLFHYALKPHGYLWLGISETIGHFSDLFAVENARHKIFSKRRVPTPANLVVPLVQAAWEPAMRATRRDRPTDAHIVPEIQKEADRLALARYAPPGVLINQDLDILQFRGDTSPYLAAAPGKPSVNVLKMAREGLMVGLRSALDQARHEKAPVRHEGVRVKDHSGIREVTLEVVPLRGPTSEAQYFLVLFDERGAAVGFPAGNPRKPAPSEHAVDAENHLDAEGEIAHLTRELSATREFMQSLIEQQEASNEELQSANEEIQSSNEELQSINEELQTSKEEIQSSNEELTTVNEELQHRNDQFGRANDDLVNFLGSTHLALVMLGRDLVIRRFTPQAEKLLNLIAADIGRPIVDLNLPIGSPNLSEVLAEVAETGRGWEQEAQDRQGRWYSLRVRPYRTQGNRIDGAVLILVDIHDQKRREAQLQASEERYRLLVDGAVGVAIIRLDDDGHVTGWNIGAERLFGYTESEIIGEHIRRFFLPEDIAAHLPEQGLQQARDVGISAEDNWRLRKDGSRFWASDAVTVLRDEAGQLRGYSKIVRDISERKKAEDESRANERRKDEFLAMLAHELRNPLAPLRSSLEILHKAPEDKGKFHYARSVMDRQVRKLTRMVDDLLDLSRITKGKIELRREVLDLRALIPFAVETLQTQFDAQQHQVSQSVTSTPLIVKGDRTRLEQIITNLLTNAVKYTNRGGHINIQLKREDKHAVLRIEDNGIGIAPELLPYVFDPFRQADSSLAREYGGLGIGLTLVRQLVELHDGTVEAHSDGLGHGCEFVVRLPLAEGEVASSKARPHKPPQTAHQRVPRRLLIVDDNVDATVTLSMLLQISGHDVKVAHSGTEAFRVLADFIPEAIVLDIGLPGMDGYEVAQRIRQRPELKAIFIIALSGYGQADDRRRSEEAGFDFHLLKPLDFNELERLLAGLKPSQKK